MSPKGNNDGRKEKVLKKEPMFTQGSYIHSEAPARNASKTFEKLHYSSKYLHNQ
jgi:hypothetical protein